MSTIKVANYANEDGSKSVGADYVVDGSAKAWVNFNGTGTIAARDSLNVSSLTDNGTGDYTINLSSSMSSGNYNAVSVGSETNNAKDSLIDSGFIASGSVRVYWQLSGVDYTDTTYGNCLIHGDLA